MTQPALHLQLELGGPPPGLTTEQGEQEPFGSRPVRGQDELRELVDRVAPTYADAPAEAVIDWAVAEFGPRWALASSMQDAVLVDLVARRCPGIDVLFLDTGYHFPQTLATRAEVARRYPVTLVDVRPEQTPAEQDQAYGPDLFAVDPHLCCLLRKATPLFVALDGYEAWATGIRRAEAVTRENTATVAFDEAHGMVKLAPLAGWSDDDVARYVAEHNVARNPLLEQGYPSIGCAPCTRPVAAGEDPRAGRWSGLDKTECGIHR